MTPSVWFAGRQSFGENDGENWRRYVEWLGRRDFRRVITLDTMLNPNLVSIRDEGDWGFSVCENFLLDFFTDLEFVRRRVAGLPNGQILGAMRRPTREAITTFRRPDFEFAGFDLLDEPLSASALLNCRHLMDDLPQYRRSADSGLLADFAEAQEARELLQSKFPEEDHADCDVWALWVYRGSIE